MLKENRTHAASSRLKLSASAVALLTVIGTGAAYAQEATEPMETVVVTGFRESLEKAMDMKRAALISSDSILAEDIAKFPDMNVSESLQRIPGVVITRDAGEGREITVRGLGPLFSRVRINGMEAMSTAGGSDASGGTNRGRQFDFNVFGAELFSGLTVDKSASASLEEGSLGATVDMRTARPFDYGKFVLTTSLSEGYNDFAQSANPRGTFLISDVLANGKLGVLFSAAYNVRHSLEAGASTVRFGIANTSGGLQNTGQTVSSTVTNATVIRPRMPRYELYRAGEKRLGLSGAVQYQPDDATLFTLAGLFSDFASQREETQLEMQTNLYGTLSALTNQTYTPAGAYYYQSVLASASGASIRTEHRVDHLDTRFMQLTLEGSHSFSEAFKVNASVGWSESHARNPVQDYIMLDDLGVAGYGYDFSGAQQNWLPKLTYGNADVTVAGLPTVAPSAGASGNCVTGQNCWYVSSFRRRPQFNYNSFRTSTVDFSYDPFNWLNVTGGFDCKNYGFRTVSYRLTTGSGTSTASTSYESFATAYGTSTSAAFYGSGSTSTTFAYNVLHTKISSIATTTHLPSGLSVPAGTPTSWLVVDFDKAQAAWNYQALATGPGPDLGNNRSVRENDYGGWLQAAWNTDVAGIPFRGNIGGRLVETEVAAVGYNLDTSGNMTASASRKNYHDFLPSLNMVAEPLDNLLIRVNASQVMSRPDLGTLAGDYISVSGSSHSINVSNSNLKPFRANAVDVATEWYYDKGAMLSVAFFYKKVGTFISSVKSTITPDSSGNVNFVVPAYVNGVSKVISAATIAAACGSTPSCTTSSWAVSESINTPGGKMRGIEINWQQPFSFLPAPYDNFGVTANATIVESHMAYLMGSAYAYHALTNQSRNSYNTTLYYDDTVFQARMSVAYRSHYFTTLPGSYSDYEAGDDTFNVDASASYKFDENFMLTFDALNLTNQFQKQYTGWYGDNNKYMYVNHQTGTDYYIGIKYDY